MIKNNTFILCLGKTMIRDFEAVHFWKSWSLRQRTSYFYLSNSFLENDLLKIRLNQLKLQLWKGRGGVGRWWVGGMRGLPWQSDLDSVIFNLFRSRLSRPCQLKQRIKWQTSQPCQTQCLQSHCSWPWKRISDIFLCDDIDIFSMLVTTTCW